MNSEEAFVYDPENKKKAPTEITIGKNIFRLPKIQPRPWVYEGGMVWDAKGDPVLISEGTYHLTTFIVDAVNSFVLEEVEEKI